MSAFPLQHQEMRELRKLLCLAEALLSSEREAHHITALGFQQEARDQDQKIGSLSEQLLLLQQELDRSLRDKADLEEQMKVYKEDTQLVGSFSLSHDRRFQLEIEGLSIKLVFVRSCFIANRHHFQL